LTFVRNSSNRGFAGGNNLVLRHLLSTDCPGYVWMLNNDMVVAPEALSCMIAVATGDAGIAAVGATVLDYHEPELVQEAAGGRVDVWTGLVNTNSGLRRRDQLRTDDPLDYVSGGCLLVSVETIREVGLLDERFFLYGEDIDWGLRMRGNGRRLAYCAEASVWHKGSASTGLASPLKDYHIVKSSLLFVHKHAPRTLPVAMAHGVVRVLLPKLARGQWARLGSVGRAWWDFMKAVSA
jgi:GT2 family glycosyltransferase